MVFLKELFEKDDFEKSADDKNKLPSKQRVKDGLISSVFLLDVSNVFMGESFQD